MPDKADDLIDISDVSEYLSNNEVEEVLEYSLEYYKKMTRRPKKILSFELNIYRDLTIYL